MTNIIERLSNIFESDNRELSAIEYIRSIDILEEEQYIVSQIVSDNQLED
jgi:hypothetical protein